MAVGGVQFAVGRLQLAVDSIVRCAVVGFALSVVCGVVVRLSETSSRGQRPGFEVMTQNGSNFSIAVGEA